MPPIASTGGPVFACPPPAPKTLPLDSPLAVGFGSVAVFKDSETVWSGDDERVLLRQFDEQAKREGGTWMVQFMGPLSDEEYTRRNDGQWHLTHRGQGFA